MAKAIQFEGVGINFTAEITKVDRRKLYGYSVVNITDNNGKPCSLATLSDDGIHILPSGTTGLVKLDHNGDYIDKSAIQVIDSEGNPAEKKISSFDKTVTLKTVNGIESYLDLNVKSIYQLDVEEEMLEQIKKVLHEHKVLEFEFSYRSDYTEDDAFLLYAQNTLFMVIGNKVEVEFLGLENIEVEEDDEEEDGDDMDFAMF